MDTQFPQVPMQATDRTLQAIPGSRTIAVMQPYFFPYAAYFSLFAHVDEFIIFDCVQFRRRGRIHRTEVPAGDGATKWLTLPIAYSPQDALIRDIRFADDARREFDGRLESLSWLNATAPPVALLRDFLHGPLDSFPGFLEQGLRLVCGLLGLHTTVSRSSALDIPADVRAQERIIAIAKARGATRYLNLPGGTQLYDAGVFRQAGLELGFLPAYHGPYRSMLHSLATQDLNAIRKDVIALGPEEWH
jgi:hypothetical protein